VSGTPDAATLAVMPPVNSARTQGLLSDERNLAVFRVTIDTPPPGTSYSRGQLSVLGRVVHGRPITAVFVNGKSAQTILIATAAKAACSGPTYEYAYSARLDSSDILTDLRTQALDASALDRGGNIIHAIANDGLNTTSTFMAVVPGGAEALSPLSTPSPLRGGGGDETCVAADLTGFVRNGISLAVGSDALAEVVSHNVNGAICRRVSSYLQGLVGTVVAVRTNACGDSCKIAPDAHEDGVEGQERGRLRGIADATVPVEHLPDRRVQAGGALQVDLGNLGGAQSYVVVDAVGTNEMTASQVDNSRPSEQMWRYVYYAHCAELGSRTVRIEQRQFGVLLGIKTFKVNVDCPDDRVTNIRVLSAQMDPDAVQSKVRVVGDSVDVEVTIKRIEIHVDPPNQCFADCWLFCCCGYNANDVRVLVKDLVGHALIPREALLCGFAAGVQPRLVMESPNVSVDLIDGDLTGAVCDIVDFFSLGVVGQLGDIFAAIKVKSFEPAIAAALTEAFENVASGSGALAFGGLADRLRVIDYPISGAAPVAMSTEAGKDLRVSADGLDLGIWSKFEPLTLDPQMTSATAWIRTPAGRPSGRALGGNGLGLFVSDDALNQLLSAVAQTGVIRVQLGRDSSLTLGSLNMDARILQRLGLASNEPLLLDLRSRQGGTVIPPTCILADDPTTRAVELVVRAQLESPLLFPRGNDIDSVLAADPSTFCACGDVSSDEQCAKSPCVLGTKSVKIDFFAHCDAVQSARGGWSLVTSVDSIRDVSGTPAFTGYEATDLAPVRAQLVNSAGPSGLLDNLRARINEKLPHIELDPELFTLRGALAPPREVKMVSLTTDSAGLGTADWVGIVRTDAEGSGPVACEGAAPSLMKATVASKGLAELAPSPEGIPRGFSGVSPNPSRDGATLVFGALRNAEFQMDVISVTGQRVATVVGKAHAGRNEIRWPGVCASGRAADPGVYYLVVRCDGESIRKPFVLLR